jgi:hypothetical protein
MAKAQSSPVRITRRGRREFVFTTERDYNELMHIKRAALVADLNVGVDQLKRGQICKLSISEIIDSTLSKFGNLSQTTTQPQLPKRLRPLKESSTSLRLNQRWDAIDQTYSRDCRRIRLATTRYGFSRPKNPKALKSFVSSKATEASTSLTLARRSQDTRIANR